MGEGIQLEIGKTYTDGWGTHFVIGGLTRDHPEWVWSLSGNWYVKATGQFVATCSDRWQGRVCTSKWHAEQGHDENHRVLHPMDGFYNLKKEVPPCALD